MGRYGHSRRRGASWGCELDGCPDASAQQAATPAIHCWSRHSPGGTVILTSAMGSRIAPSS
jgi:hypothetical protein